ncbi:MAG: transporter substrate-binding domain-containing protein [Spirochaetia bacterium]|jgi:ABC-type amino acid transport substrate-binding protein|nr:transporter substrate-binding domain-containing protein [Spirochaetia bacterium]
MKKIIIIFVIIFISFPLAAEEKLQLRIGTYENAPKIFTDESGKIAGFWADITNYIAEKENWEIEWVQGDWDQCIQRLENNEIDILVDVGVTPDRQEQFLFSNETVLLSWSRLYIQEGKKLESIMDLDGREIAGLKGSFNIDGPEGLKDIIDRFDLDCRIIELDNYHQVFDALQNKEIFAGITNKDFGNKNEIKYSITRTAIIFQPARMQFAFPKLSKISPMLIKEIDNNLSELKNDNNSIYYKSMERHLGGVKEIHSFPLWVKMLVVILIIFSAIFIIFSYFLKYQVNRKTILLQQNISELEQIKIDLFLSNTKYQSLFDNSPAPLWVEDFTELSNYLNELKEKGISDFRTYFANRPEELYLCAKKVKVEDVNLASLQLHQAENKEDLLNNLERLFTGKSFDVFKEEVIAIAEGDLEFESESEVKTLRGELRYISLKLLIDGDQVNTRRALLATTDITNLKKAEKELQKHKEHLEELVKERTIELEGKNEELEQFNSLFVDREFRIKELRERVKELEGRNT